MLEQNIFYVYIWYDPRNDKPFYVGKGKDNRAYSIQYYHRNEFFIRKYNKIQSEGYTPYVNIVIDNLSEEQALKEELKLIKKYKPYHEGGILTNLTYFEGGKSIISPSTRDKLSKQSSGESNGMNRFTEEQIRYCFELLTLGYCNTDIQNKTSVPHYVISDLKLGKKWKHLYEEYKNDIPKVKMNTSLVHEFTFYEKLSIIQEIDTRNKKEILLKDLAKKYNLKDTYMVSINLKRQWKDIWDYYLTNKKS